MAIKLLKSKISFKSPYIKLTLFYVLIVMIISITFSVVIYRISFGELGRGLARQSRVLRELPDGDIFGRPWPGLEEIRLNQIQESSIHLRNNLIYFNLIILILSTIASYYFSRRTMQPIEEMLEAQNRFTADASHELRTPLTAMQTEIEVALRDKKLSTGQAKELLKSNLEEVGKLGTLSGALLKLARYDEKRRVNFKRVNLQEIITDAITKLESAAKQKSIEIKTELSDLNIKGDQESLVELFVILLDNAIKYSPEKSEVFIEAEKKGEKAAIKVKDQGVGIKASDLPYIFNRFYRADSSRTKEKVAGYGLGLSIAKQIVELHSGTIFAKSSPGKGSEFTVII